MHIVAPQAESLIGEGVIALEMGATLEDVGLSRYLHPTLTEGIMDAAEASHGKAIHIVNPEAQGPGRGEVSSARLLDLGLRPYREVWELQRRLHDAVREGREPDTWIVVEHHPVVTLGRQAKRENPSLSPEALAARAIDLGPDRARRRRHLSRSGAAGRVSNSPARTVSGGGAVGVPLEGALIECCARFGVSGVRWNEHAGVWVGDKSICAIGLAVKRMVSMHGLALNVSTDLRYARPDQSLRVERSRHHLALRADGAPRDNRRGEAGAARSVVAHVRRFVRCGEDGRIIDPSTGSGSTLGSA